MVKYRQVLISIIFIMLIFSLPRFLVKAQSINHNPIIIIPGIMGSWNWDIMMGKSFGDSWNFTPFTHVYDGLVKSLENAGLQKDKDFFIAFYDWRKGNFNSASDYLKPIINKAKEISGKSKVDIIAHSMGGLVARAYIEGGHYENDVANFIMLGTPNYGSSDVYTLWEGGYVPNNWDHTQQRVISYYLEFLKWLGHDVRTIYDVIHQDIPSTRELLPVYDYLTDKNTGEPKFFDLMQEQNAFLQVLNSSQNLNKLFNGVEKLIVIAGKDLSTVNEIPVKTDLSEAPLWQDGKPDPLDPARNDSSGDSRVLLSSAKFQFGLITKLNNPKIFAGVLKEFFKNIFSVFYKKAFAQLGSVPLNYNEIIKQGSGHGNLPYDAISDIFSTLNLNIASTTIPQQYPQFAKELVVMVGSPVNVSFRDSSSRVVSSNINQIPNAEYNQTPDQNGPKMIFIPEPLSGTSTITLGAIGAGGSFHLGVEYLDGSGDKFQEYQGSIETGQNLRLRFNLAQNGAPEPLSNIILVDNSPPASVINYPQNNGFYNLMFWNKNKIKGTASDDASGVKEIDIEILKQWSSTLKYFNNGVWQTNEAFNVVSGTRNWTYDFTPMEDGLYTIKERAIDNYLNTESWRESSFIYDNTLPGKVSFNPAPANYDSGQNIILSSDDKNLEGIYYTLDGNSPNSSSTKYETLVNIEKSINIKALAIDKAGNQSDINEGQYLIGLNQERSSSGGGALLILNSENSNNLNNLTTINKESNNKNSYLSSALASSSESSSSTLQNTNSQTQAHLNNVSNNIMRQTKYMNTKPKSLSVSKSPDKIISLVSMNKQNILNFNDRKIVAGTAGSQEPQDDNKRLAGIIFLHPNASTFVAGFFSFSAVAYIIFNLFRLKNK